MNKTLTALPNGNNSNDNQEFIELLSSTLPPVIARKEVGHFLGGIISRKTLANADARGEGPEGAYAVGKSIVYRTDSLLQWVKEKYAIKKQNSIRTLEV